MKIKQNIDLIDHRERGQGGQILPVQLDHFFSPGRSRIFEK